MAKESDILSMYGKDSGAPEKPRATNGGQMECKPLNYDPPKGPTNQHRQVPGLGGETHMCGTQGKH